METNTSEQTTSVMPPEQGGSPTIGAKPINAQSVVNPIRIRFRSSQVVWYLLGVIEILLLLRFVLKFIGANISAGFTQFIYVISSPLAGSFMNVVDPSQIGRSIFDWSILLAMIIYALIAWGAVKLLVMSQPTSDQEAHNKLDSQN
jgi:hypothetical protein